MWSLGATAFVLVYGRWPYMPGPDQHFDAAIRSRILAGTPAPCFRSDPGECAWGVVSVRVDHEGSLCYAGRSSFSTVACAKLGVRCMVCCRTAAGGARA